MPAGKNKSSSAGAAGAASVRLGILFIALGVLANYWMLHTTFSVGAGSTSKMLLVSFADLLGIGVGLLLIKFRRRIRPESMILRLLSRSFIIGSTVIAGSFVVFMLAELFPGFAGVFDFRPIVYYSIRDSRFMSDSELVFKKRPFVEFESTELRGDLYNPAYGVDVQPHAYRSSVDADGFRNHHHGDQADIVVLGDAYVEMGDDDTDTFAYHLQQFSGLTTANYGTGWYGPHQYLVMLKRYGLGKNPRYVLFCFFEGNELKNIIDYLRWREGDYLILWPPPMLSFFQRYAMFIRNAYSTIPWLARPGSQLPPAVTPHVGPGIHPDLVKLDLPGRSVIDKFVNQSDTRTPQQLLDTEEVRELRSILTEFRALCVEQMIVPMVVFFPMKAHVYAGLVSPDSGSKWNEIRDEQLASLDNVENTVSIICEQVGIEFISVTAALTQRAKGDKLLFYHFGTHWASDGRKVAAEYTADQLRSREAEAQ